MGENMVKKGIIIVAAVSIGIAVGAYLILSLFTTTGVFESKTYIDFSEIPITLEEMARTSEVIVIGKVGSTVGTEHYDVFTIFMEYIR
jgi:hypothetical protein